MLKYRVPSPNASFAEPPPPSQALCQRCLVPETCKPASDCLIAMFSLCTPLEAAAAQQQQQAVGGRPGGGGGGGTTPPFSAYGGSYVAPAPLPSPCNPRLLRALLQQWQAVGYSLENHPTDSGDPAAAAAAAAGEEPAAQSPPGGSHQGAGDVRLAACHVMCAAAGVVLRPALAAAAPAPPPPPSGEGASSGGSSGGSASAALHHLQVRKLGRTGESAPHTVLPCHLQAAPLPAQKSFIHHVQGQQRAALAVYLQPFTAIAEQLISHLRNCDDAVRMGGVLKYVTIPGFVLLYRTLMSSCTGHVDIILYR